jgi:hypothetical protein
MFTWHSRNGKAVRLVRDSVELTEGRLVSLTSNPLLFLFLLSFFWHVCIAAVIDEGRICIGASVHLDVSHVASIGIEEYYIPVSIGKEEYKSWASI